ncbi:MAG: beta-ketoacyl synthase chain length factor [Bacteroidales bacterium]|nr:beta-ketoacyl synthase chain length factor [Bacteroidales bacterium]MBR5063455.1 beta-ketoacyl synthase chain length factor [Bacteroidales bacterium]
MSLRPVFIRAIASLGTEDPDFRQLFSPLEARRMGRLLKRAVWTSRKALDEAGLEMPDAIVTGTDFGSMIQSEAFLGALKQGGDATPRPTNFMQSTHNTIGSLIAIQLGCHGYNATYSHKGNSFLSALQDAWMQISLGDIDTALVGWFDEDFPPVGSSDKAISVVLTASPEGAMGTYEALLGTLLES